MLIVSVIDPILSDLARAFRVRSGEGPKSLKGRQEAVRRSIEAHETLGLDSTALKSILDPTIDAEGVISARRALVEGWSAHPADVGERAMTLLCTRLAERYYAKARRDGTARRAQVVTSGTEPLLNATLENWEALLDYLGEAPADADAHPVRLDPVALPQAPPGAVSERISVAQDWFQQVFDPAHAEQEPGTPSLWGLVPSPHVFEDDGERTSGGDHDPDLWESRLPPEMAERIRELWGSTVLQRYPDVLVEEPHPEAQFAVLLEPAARVWEGIALTCWFLCFGPYSRTTLSGLQEYHQHALDELSDLGSPVDPAVFQELIDAGRGTEWLFQQAFEIGVEITVTEDLDVEMGEPDQNPAKSGANEVFRRLRDVVTRHRRAWIQGQLDRYLDARWRRDLETAANAYRELHVGRGKPPTVKQAFPKLHRAAATWFGGDLSELARAVHLDGPVTEPMRRSELELPSDMPQVRRKVSRLLGGSMDRKGDDYWPRRRRFELSLQVGGVLALWQASGELPSRPAFGKNWLLKEAFPGDVDAGYHEYIEAIRQALKDIGHPAADAPMAQTRGGRARAAS